MIKVKSTPTIMLKLSMYGAFFGALAGIVITFLMFGFTGWFVLGMFVGAAYGALFGLVDGAILALVTWALYRQPTKPTEYQIVMFIGGFVLTAIQFLLVFDATLSMTWDGWLLALATPLIAGYSSWRVAGEYLRAYDGRKKKRA